LHVPPLGTAADGKPCPTVRDFFVVDQDQSDNLPTTYLSTEIGLAQKTQVTVAQFPDATTIGNPSDNRLVDVALDGALGRPRKHGSGSAPERTAGTSSPNVPGRIGTRGRSHGPHERAH
jgi:hypothetical protein